MTTYDDYPPDIFKYSSNKNFREIGNQPRNTKKYKYTANYANNGKTLVSYTLNGETETLNQLNKDKDNV